MININKLIVALSILAILIFVPTFVLAKSENANPNAKGNKPTVTPKNNEPKPSISPNANSNKNLRYLKNTVQSVEEAQEEINDEEVDQELETIQGETEETDKTINNSFKNMEGRPGFLKFIMGPDYKNAGQIRSSIVHLRNQIRQLTRLESKVTEGQQDSIQATVANLNQELIAIQTRLYENLQGFSLFGWLAKLLTGFTPPPSPSPSPTGSPEASITPSPSLVPTESPTATPEATLEPTATP